jgi:hypothetical protein
LRLFTPIPDIFICRGCMKPVTVTIRAPLMWTLR